MIGEGCVVNYEVYIVFLFVYSRSGRFDDVFIFLEFMKSSYNCQFDVYIYFIFIKLFFQVFVFDKVQVLFFDMRRQGIRFNIIIYNIFIDAYGKVKM